jgi:signal transduction histidine kinase
MLETGLQFVEWLAKICASNRPAVRFTQTAPTHAVERSTDMGFIPSSSAFGRWRLHLSTEKLIRVMSFQWLQQRSATEHLLIIACLVAGGVMFIEGPIAGGFSLAAAIIAASEIAFRRAMLLTVFVIIAAIVGCFALTDSYSGLLLGLVDIAAVTMPLYRTYFRALVASQMILLTYVAGYVASGLTFGRDTAWWQLLVNVVVFNVVSGVGNDLASRRRNLETSLEHEVQQAQTLAEALKREESLRLGLTTMRSETDKDSVLRSLVESVSQVVNAEFVQILLLDGEAALVHGGPMASRHPMATQRGTGLLASSPVYGSAFLRDVVTTQAPVWIRDLNQQPWVEEAVRLGFVPNSLALVPIVVSRTVYAVLELAWQDRREVSLSDRALITALVEQAGAALERVGISEELAQRAEGAEALHQVSARLAGRRDIRLIAEDALKALRSLYGADAAAFYLSNADNEADAFVAQGLSVEGFTRLHAEYASGQRGRLLRSGRSVVISEIAEDRRLRTRELLAREGIASLIDVPAVWEDRTMGGLVLYHHNRRNYASYEIELLETFAQQLAGGMELAEAYRAIETFDRQREEFLALMSHELRQPVAGIAAMAEALAGTPDLGPSESAALLAMRQQARNLTALAEDVLSIAQLETGQLTLRPTRFDLVALLAGVCTQSADAARLQAELPTVPVIVYGDPERIGQALQNIIGNALKYSEPKLDVRVTLRATADAAIVEVRDQGVGIEAEQIPHLFQKYARMPNQLSNVVKGAGLGLYLTRLLIEAHGGTVSAESGGKDQGATFTIRLNLAEALMVTSPAELTTSHPPTSAGPDAHVA